MMSFKVYENLSTPKIYTQVSIEKLQEIHRVTHPGKGMVEEKIPETG